MFNIQGWIALLVVVVVGIAFVRVIMPEAANLQSVVDGYCGTPDGKVQITLGNSFRTDGYVTTAGTCATTTSGESVSLTAKGGGGSSTLTYFPTSLENNDYAGILRTIIFLLPLVIILILFGYVAFGTDIGRSTLRGIQSARGGSRGGGF